MNYTTKEFGNDIGVEVYWNDPDREICSGWYTIMDKNEEIIFLENEQGSEVEVLSSELS